MVIDKKETRDDKTLWISGLSENVRQSDLEKLLKKYGTVVKCEIIKSARNPKFVRCFGLVLMDTGEQAQSCIKQLNFITLDNRRITVEMYRRSEYNRPDTSHRQRSQDFSSIRPIRKEQANSYFDRNSERPYHHQLTRDVNDHSPSYEDYFDDFKKQIEFEQERNRLENEKQLYLLRMEQEKVRIGLKRMSEERTELLRIQSQLNASQNGSDEPMVSSSFKQGHENLYEWKERKQFSTFSSTIISSSQPSFGDKNVSPSSRTAIQSCSSHPSIMPAAHRSGDFHVGNNQDNLDHSFEWNSIDSQRQNY